MSETQPRTMSIEVSRRFEAGDERAVSALLVGCSEDEAPRRYAHPAAQGVCHVHGDFSDIPLSQLPKSRSTTTGREYYEIDFKLQATFSSEQIIWQLMYKGREYGKTSVSYDE
jgi:hypothetical protein